MVKCLKRMGSVSIYTCLICLKLWLIFGRYTFREAHLPVDLCILQSANVKKL